MNVTAADAPNLINWVHGLDTATYRNDSADRNAARIADLYDRHLAVGRYYLLDAAGAVHCPAQYL